MQHGSGSREAHERHRAKATGCYLRCISAVLTVLTPVVLLPALLCCVVPR